MIISVTERGTFKRCPQKWHYESRNGLSLTPVVPPQALGFGTMIHEAHEQWLLRPSADPAVIVLEVADAAEKRIRAAYLKAVGAPASDEELITFYENVDLAREVIVNYKAYWGSSLPDGYELVQPEQTVLIPIPGTSHQLEATMDALIRNPAGLLFVLERKTYGQRPKLDVLEMNDQFLAYGWAVSKLGLGEVGGVLYDGMWKRRLEGKRTLDDLFVRHVLTRAPQEYVNFERELAIEANAIARTHANPEANLYRNFQWQGCWDCSVRPLCLAEFRGEDANWVREVKFTTRESAEWLEEEDSD